ECIFVCCGLISTDVAAYEHPRFTSCQAPGRCSSAFIVEAHSIDQCPICRKAKKARLFIAGLWFWCYSTNFNETKTQCGQLIHSLCILIESSRQPYGVPECQSGKGAFQTLVVYIK